MGEMQWLRLDFIDYTTEINAPCEEVFTFFKHIEQWPSWARGIKRSFRKVAGSDWGIGFQIGFVPRFLRVPLNTKILAYEENRVIEWGFRTPIASLVHRFDFEPLDEERCRVRHREYARGILAILTCPLKNKLEDFDRGLADDLRAAFNKGWLNSPAPHHKQLH
jgi:hypothetical protein